MYEFDGFRLDSVRRQLRRPDGELVALMPKAMETLAYLVERAGHTVSKEDLLRSIWSETIVEENNLTQNISALRKALGERAGEHRFIVTIPGRGYRFVATVTHVEPAPAAVSATAATPRARSVEDEAVRDGPRRAWIGYAVLAITAAVVAIWWVQRGNDPVQPAAPTQTIAVLPFKPVVIEQRDEAMEMGMADSIIMELSRSTDLIVRPLTTTRRYLDLDQDPLTAGRALGVDAVLEGTIQIAQERVRASARLLRVRDGRQLWADKFDERYVDVFTVQDAIAQRVAAALAVRLSSSTERRTQNLRAYELYMRGRLHAMRLVMPEVRTAIGFFEQAIIEDPSYALAYAGIAEAMRPLALSNDVAPSELMPRAKIAAQRALELDPQLPEALLARGMVAFMFDWDWRTAQECLSRAVELAPNNSEARIYLAHLYSNLARKQEALDHARRASELNPISPLIAALEGQFLGHQGEHDAALRRLQDAVSLEPRFWLSHHLLANELLGVDRFEEALRESALAKQHSPLQTYSDAITALAFVGLGRTDEARSVLETLTQMSDKAYVPPTHIAMIHAALGEPDAALAHLEDAVTVRDPRLAFLKIDRNWQSLRSDPRFIDLMARVGYQE